MVVNIPLQQFSIHSSLKPSLLLRTLNCFNGDFLHVQIASCGDVTLE
jgi:hypothetical protein